jgi:hypothetical protein
MWNLMIDSFEEQLFSFAGYVAPTMAILRLVDRDRDHPAIHFVPLANIPDAGDDHCAGKYV